MREKEAHLDTCEAWRIRILMSRLDEPVLFPHAWVRLTSVLLWSP